MRGSEGARLDFLARHWRPGILLLWAVIAAWLLWDRSGAIRGFALGDTDDNLRMMQVRALLDGQSWFDLRQYRLNPPFGADIHWSRLVDLPIAAIRLAATPFVGVAKAEIAAAALAPLLPMLVAMGSMAVIARRLVDGRAWPIAILLLFCASSARGMWSPLRIDHHGWQLAMLALALAALTDPRRARGGALLGVATALSLAIGLEMLLYLALAGALTVLRWIQDRGEARRLAAYGAALGGGCAAMFLLFASEANRAPVCDALSPVWLSAMVAAGAIAAALATANPRSAAARAGAAALLGLMLAGGFALAWPDCLGRLEQAPPELKQLWLNNVREAMPLYRHGHRIAVQVALLPMLGLVGSGLMLWRHWREQERGPAWLAVFLAALLSAALLLWQTRAGPAAQTLSIPGATALAWTLLAWFLRQRRMAVRLAGIAILLALFVALANNHLAKLFPSRISEARRTINLANARCPSVAALRPVGNQPRGMVLTFVDLGPRLITITHHDALAGPYHRNARQIIDVMRAWRGDEDLARQTIARYRVDYVLICPNLSESTIYRSQAPRGFYAQLSRGELPQWLEPIPLPEGSPYRMWRVVSGIS